MGYFSNGTEGKMYEDKWCARCYHDRKDVPCPVLDTHRMYNYEECNNDRSILHKMIPRERTPGVLYRVNGRCTFFDSTDDNDDLGELEVVEEKDRVGAPD